MEKFHLIAQRLFEKTNKSIVDPVTGMTGINLGSVNTEQTRSIKQLQDEAGNITGLEFTQTTRTKGAFFQGFTTGDNPEARIPTEIKFNSGNIDVTLE